MAALALTPGCINVTLTTESGTTDNSTTMSLVGRRAPAIEAQAVSAEDEFLEVDLDALFAGKNYLLLVFYPGDFTFVCPTELTALSRRYEEFAARDCALAAVSVDSRDVHLAWRLTPVDEGGVGRLRFPLVADRNALIAKTYGVLAADGSAMRAWFIVERKGARVRHQLVNDAAHGRNLDEALRLLDAVRFTASHDGVCPMDWNAGEATIEPTRIGIRRFLDLPR